MFWKEQFDFSLRISAQLCFTHVRNAMCSINQSTNQPTNQSINQSKNFIHPQGAIKRQQVEQQAKIQLN